MYEYRRLTAEQRKEVVFERWLKGFPPHSPPHPIRDAAEYLITAACFEHRAILSTAERRAELVQVILGCADEAGVEVRAWVVLPNHYHVLLGAEIERIQRLMKRVNGSTAAAWNKADGARGRQVWYRYSDRAIRGEDHWYSALAYIHENPVKHGCVADATDWPASSVHWYADTWGTDHLAQIDGSYPRRGMGRGWDDMTAGS